MDKFNCIKDINLLKGKIIVVRTCIDTELLIDLRKII